MYDAIIVGARCAGSITALCLARHGARVLVLDRTTLPSDTLSTANYDRGAATRFRALGVGEAIAATGAPLLPHIRIADVDHVIGFTGTFQLDAGAEQGPAFVASPSMPSSSMPPAPPAPRSASGLRSRS